jgi:AraC-like DNA-binding protein
MISDTLTNKLQPQRKQAGFKGQRSVVLPLKIEEQCAVTPILSTLYITDIGYYQLAAHHFKARPEGISQHILIYCTEGQGWVKLPSGHFDIATNEMLIIPANMPHEYGAHDVNPWTIYWAHFKGTQSNYYTAQLSHNYKSWVHACRYSDERIRLFDSIFHSLESGYSIDNLSYANISFAYFLSSFFFADKFAYSQDNFKKDLVDLSVDFMRKNIAKALTLEEIASSINLSVSHYSNLFRKKTGYSPVVYFNHLKVQHACQYLQFTSLRVNEISLKLGIDDPYYFTRMFTRVMGMSPSQYRTRKN